MSRVYRVVQAQGRYMPQGSADGGQSWYALGRWQGYKHKGTARRVCEDYIARGAGCWLVEVQQTPEQYALLQDWIRSGQIN